jgi:hypothetical protein
MKRILFLQSLITVSVVSMTLVVLLAGRVLGRSSEALGRAEDCQLPCWNNLRPGEMSLNEASNILRNLGYRLRTNADDQGINAQFSYRPLEPSSVCEVALTGGGGGILREVILRMCEPLPIGEVLNLIGEPQSMLPIASLMIFQEGQTILTMRMPMCEGRSVSLHSTVRFISLADESLNIEVVRQPSDLPWEGFVPFWRYMQLYPDKAVCPYVSRRP